MNDLLSQLFSGHIPMVGYVGLSLVMFFAGIYGFLTRKSLLMILISVELILNAADLNFAVFNRYLHVEHFEGFFFTLFTIGISAAEAAVAIAIIINIYRNINEINVDKLNNLSDSTEVEKN